MTNPPPADWHEGEQALQAFAGSKDRLAGAASRIMRPFLTEQHRAFFPRLPFLVTGCVDADGSPWASILVGPPGFCSSPDPHHLRIDALPAATDPLTAALCPGASIGLLGIQLSTRRRNRLNGRVVAVDTTGFLVAVEQSFGNCPQYIQRRDDVAFTEPRGPAASTEFRGLDDPAARALLSNCDTFFVATYADAEARGVDVSHRGGRPGFVRVNPDGRLTIPDYSGNRYYNTLGNILMTRRAALIVPDFEYGDLLLVTGRASLGLDGQDLVQRFHETTPITRSHRSCRSRCEQQVRR